MEKKMYRIAPYEKEHWQWLWYAAGATFLCWCFSEYFWFSMPGWAYGLIFFVACLGFGFARIRQRGVELFLSDEGIRVRNGGRETVPLTPWSAFECGYILTLISNGGHEAHDADTYFLLSGKPLNKDALDKVAFDLLATKPCGIWKDYIAVKTSKAENNTIRNAIGTRLLLKELRIDPDAVAEEMEE